MCNPRVSALKMNKVNLLLCIHCHQPVGNFESIFQKAYASAYLPFIQTLSKHPNIKFSLHYSGNLLDWLKEKQKNFLRQIKELVERGQVEIIAGGYYEPILALINGDDALSQIELLKQAIKELFSYSACGFWLTERVWEPGLPYILSKAGLSYTIVDDSHFRYAAMEPEEISGYYISEEKGKQICLFAGSERLRYLIPFKLPEEVIGYLKNRLEKSKQDITVTFADDGEKFGLWPGTHKWVYQEGWLDNFLTQLGENSDWIKLETFSEFMDTNPASGRVYLPCASYSEMMEWSGGNFRNFLLKYEEAHNMYRKMRYVSNKVRSYELQVISEKNLDKPEPIIHNSKLIQAKRHLYMGQDNDAYWHGVFGGLYLNHLRSSVYEHLISAENIVDNILSKKGRVVQEIDFNLDGNNEIIMTSSQHRLYFSPKLQGALFEWDYKPKSLNLVNTIMRRPEPYHDRLKQKINLDKERENQPLSIHEIAKIKEGVLNSSISYDLTLRYSLIEHFLSKSTKLEDFLDSRHNERGDFLNSRYEYEIIDNANNAKVKFWRKGKVDDTNMLLEKHILLDKDLLVIYALKNLSDKTVSAVFGIEFNFSVYEPALSARPGVITANKLNIRDIWYGLRLNLITDRSINIWHFPVETLSDSEAGLEKTYQELCILFRYELDLPPQALWKTRVEINIS